MAPRDFVDYPKPVRAPETKYESPPLHNPTLRGMPLQIAGQLIGRLPFVQRFFWDNAGFGKLKDLPELDEMDFRFHPLVTPLGEQKTLDVGPELLRTKKQTPGAQYYTVADYHDMYASGQVTPLQVAEMLLRVTKEGPYADAWADKYGQEDELALQAAREATERFARGKPLGVLDGVPVGIKDDTDVKGFVSHTGLQYRGDLPWFRVRDETLHAVRMLQEAGAVVIGKNRMHELGSDTNGLNPRQGTPTNHFNQAYYPGGSTSGGGSATGAGVVPITVGTDAGGSIRLPANYNGVYGLKPSHHRMGHFNMTLAVRGPLAASAADLTIAYRIMAQPDPACSVSGRFATSQPPAAGSRRVMGIYRDWWADADPEVRQVCDKAVDHFRTQMGYDVIDISLPFIPEARVAHTILCMAELGESGRRKDPGSSRGWLDMVNAANKLLISTAQQTGAGDYLKANAMRELMMRHLAYLWQTHPGLLIMTPTTAIKGWPRHAADATHGLSDTNLTIRSMMYIFLSNLTGAPSLTAPVGYVPPDAGDGQLPVSLLAMAEWGEEERLLAWARDAESYVTDSYEGGRRRPATWFDVFKEAKAGAPA